MWAGRIDYKAVKKLSGPLHSKGSKKKLKAQLSACRSLQVRSGQGLVSFSFSISDLDDGLNTLN